MNKGKWWKISNSISLLFLVLIGAMWLYTTKRYAPNLNQLTNRAEVDRYLSDNFPELPQKRIPTGVFIQSFNFNSSSEVNFTGYIWQIYQLSKYKDIPDEQIPVGFILPEAVNNGSNIEPKLAYREQIDENREVIGWYFEATLKQSFNYSKYPFDHKVAWIRFWSGDFDQKSILVPSFESYQATGLNDAFGYDKDIVLGHWNLLETYFDYRTEDYNSNFGLNPKVFKNKLPELYFNIVIERHFLNSFIVYILPLIIIAGLVFATLMMITKDPEQSSIFGLNTSGVIGVCSGLFFVVLLSQVQIREQFAGSKIVYLEFLYPLMYVNLLGVSVNSYLFSRINTENNLVLKWINYEDNLIPKLIYWPFLLGNVTLLTFFILLPASHQTTLNQEQDNSFLLDKQSPSKANLLPFNFALENEYKPNQLKNFS